MASNVLSSDQIQAYINQALAAGYTQDQINSFFADNGGVNDPGALQDAGRLLSALAPNPGPGGGITTSTYVPSPGIAVPTPLNSGTSALSTSSPADGVILVHGDVQSSVPPAIVNPVTVAVPVPTSSPALIYLAIAGLLVAIFQSK